MTSSLDLHYLVKEFQFLINAKLDQIYCPSKKELILQFHVTGKGKQILRINAPDYIYLISERPEAKTPSDFCMFLRKKIANSRLRKIEQIGFERIIKLDFETRRNSKNFLSSRESSKKIVDTKEETYSIVAELFSTGNILLLKDNLILTAAEYRKWAGRTIRPKETYKIPQRALNLLKLTLNELEELVKTTNKESIVKSLAIDLGLGGKYAEEVCLIAQINKDIAPKDLQDTKKLFNAIKKITDKKINPNITFKNNLALGAFPFELEIYNELKKEFFKTFSLAIEKLIELKGELTPEQKQYLKKIEKIENVLKEQESSIKKLEKSIEDNNNKANLIYEKYQLIQEIIDKFKKAEKSFSWKEIKAKLKKHKIIKQINSKDKTIMLEL